MGIETAYNLGDDQMKSHFNIIFPNGFPIGSSGNASTKLVIRAKTHDVPEEEVGTYERNFHGQSFEMTGGHTETKRFTITFDVPKDWDCYSQLKEWKDASCDPETGARLPDASLRTTIIVQPIDIEEGGVEVPTRSPFIYRYAKPVKIGGISFDHGEKDSPITAECEFIFVVKVDKPYL
jgi:hypothetical protein